MSVAPVCCPASRVLSAALFPSSNPITAPNNDEWKRRNDLGVPCLKTGTR